MRSCEYLQVLITCQVLLSTLARFGLSDDRFVSFYGIMLECFNKKYPQKDDVTYICGIKIFNLILTSKVNYIK